MRAVHLNGRCIDCDACFNACPLAIPLNLLTKRMIEDVKLITTIDPGGESPDCKWEIGFFPTIVEKVAPSSKGTIAIVCGPPVMIKFTFPILAKLGFTDDTVYTTLENRMKCGFGKCGRCNVGKVYGCEDGPVFSLTQLKELTDEY
jgi:sulfhydrogenase subunit gamma (sulfur reductase)